MSSSPAFVRLLVGLAFGLSSAVAAAQPAPGQPAPPAPSPAQLQASQAEARRLSDAFSSVAERVSPSVVQIDVTSRDENPDSAARLFGRTNGDSPIARGTGSGVVFTPDGAILTNNHVIDDALTINVHLRDGRFLPAKLVGRDPGTDLAVIKVDATGLVAAKFADSDAARVGEMVVAIGSPFGLGYTVTTGVLSAKGRGVGMNAIEDYLQTDASINPGNSGGPLCNLDGHVLGINTMIAGRGSGIGFAVPSSLARRTAEQILKTGHVERAWIGVGIQDLTPELASAMKLDPRAGALVNLVNDNGPAAKANVKPGDVIASVAGKTVHDGRELIREVLQHDVGQTITLEIVRDGKHYGSNVALTARPEPPIPPLPVQQQGVPHAGLGMSVRDLSPQQAQQLGLSPKAMPVVTNVAPGSAADRAGIKAGDIIVEVDGALEPTSAQLQEASKDGQLLLRIRRRDAAFYAALKK
jgi:serine protease Do